MTVALRSSRVCNGKGKQEKGTTPLASGEKLGTDSPYLIHPWFSIGNLRYRQRTFTFSFISSFVAAAEGPRVGNQIIPREAATPLSCSQRECLGVVKVTDPPGQRARKCLPHQMRLDIDGS